MPTSSENTSENKINLPTLESKHWDELMTALDLDPHTQLGDWIDQDLQRLEDKLAHFASAESIKKSLSR